MDINLLDYYRGNSRIIEPVVHREVTYILRDYDLFLNRTIREYFEAEKSDSRIMIATPQLIAKLSDIEGKCFGCRIKNRSLKRCSRCKIARYCDTKCQGNDYCNHRHICETVKNSLLYVDKMLELSDKKMKSLSITRGIFIRMQEFYPVAKYDYTRHHIALMTLYLLSDVVDSIFEMIYQVAMSEHPLDTDDIQPDYIKYTVFTIRVLLGKSVDNDKYKTTNLYKCDKRFIDEILSLYSSTRRSI